MLRRHHQLLPFTSLSRTATAFSVLPVVCQKVSFASTKSTKSNARNEDEFDIDKCLAQGQARYLNMSLSGPAREERAKQRWKLAKEITELGTKPSGGGFTIKCLCTFSVLPVSASTKLQDLAIIRELFSDDFSRIAQRHRRVVTKIVSQLEEDVVAELRKNPEKGMIRAAMSSSEIRKVCGNNPIANEMDAILFKSWILGSRLVDLTRQKTFYLSDQNLVAVHQTRVKDPPFVRFVPSSQEQFQRVWQTHAIQEYSPNLSLRISHHIKNALGTNDTAMSPSTIARSSIKYLEDHGVPRADIINVTGRRGVDACLLLNEENEVLPTSKPAIEQTKNITKLIEAIFPDGKY